MDATTLGSILGTVGVISGSLVAYLGKRGENTNSRLVTEIDQIQEERDGLRVQLTAKDARLVELLDERLGDQVLIARLRVQIVELGGDPQ